MMRAAFRDPTAPAGFTVRDVADPVPAPNEALIAVRAFALNFSDLPRNDLYPIDVPMGYEAAGVVVQAAADGSGPPVNTRVTSWRLGGAMAERRALRADEMCVIPHGLSFADAATLPEAAATALHAVRALGAVAGRSILITGASGGVGRFAIQIARIAGAARIAAVVGSSAKAEGLRDLGATEIVYDLATVDGEFFGVIEGVGGRVFRDALHKTAAGGTLASIGFRSWEPIHLEPRSDVWPGLLATRRVIGVVMGFGPQVAPGETIAGDVAWLADLAARGTLATSVEAVLPFDKLGAAFERLDSRAVRGKLVISFEQNAP